MSPLVLWAKAVTLQHLAFSNKWVFYLLPDPLVFPAYAWTTFYLGWTIGGHLDEHVWSWIIRIFWTLLF